MNTKYKSLIKDTAIFAVGSFGSKLILFFLVPLYTNYLTTSEYGTAELISSFSQLIIPFTALVVNDAVIRFGMKRNTKPENVAFAALLVLGYSILFSILITPLLGMYSVIGEWKWYLCLQVIFSNISEVERCYLKVKNKNKEFAIVGILQTAVLAIANIIFLTVLNTGIRGYLAANIIALVFSSIVCFFVADLKRDLQKAKMDFGLLKEMLCYSSPLIFSNISWWVIHSSDKIMIEWIIGASALGLYTVSTKIPSLINVIIGIFNQAWGITSIREIESTNDKGFYASVFNIFVTVLFGAGILFTAMIKPFMLVYVGENFRSAWMYTPLLLSAAVFYSVSAFVGTLYSAVQKTTNNMWTTVLCAAINVTVNYVGIKTVGIWGAIMGTLTAYIVISTIRLIDVRRYIPFKIDDKRYIVNTVLLLFQAVGVSLDWHQTIISVVVMLAFVKINFCVIKPMMHNIIKQIMDICKF